MGMHRGNVIYPFQLSSTLSNFTERGRLLNIIYLPIPKTIPRATALRYVYKELLRKRADATRRDEKKAGHVELYTRFYRDHRQRRDPQTPARPKWSVVRQARAQYFIGRTACTVISSIRGSVESKSRSARPNPRSRASINILTYTTWNSRLIYCRYLGALVFGPPGADIICLKKCARQRGPPTTVLPILRESSRAVHSLSFCSSPLSSVLLPSLSTAATLASLVLISSPYSLLPEDRPSARSPYGAQLVLRIREQQVAASWVWLPARY